ncbi:MAG: YceI family protein [Acidobacteria bacterium]|nr:YceI family protein [Acidobacteriota bacterium]
MKKKVAILSAAAAVLLTASAALAAPETFSFDKGHSLVGFRIRHFVSKVEGRFREYDGTISLDRQSPAASTVDAGGVMLGDDVEINIQVEANKPLEDARPAAAPPAKSGR